MTAGDGAMKNPSSTTPLSTPSPHRCEDDRPWRRSSRRRSDLDVVFRNIVNDDDAVIGGSLTNESLTELEASTGGCEITAPGKAGDTRECPGKVNDVDGSDLSVEILRQKGDNLAPESLDTLLALHPGCERILPRSQPIQMSRFDLRHHQLPPNECSHPKADDAEAAT